MSVSVGSFSDPQGLEGLAHFLGTLNSSGFWNLPWNDSTSVLYFID